MITKEESEQLDQLEEIASIYYTAKKHSNERLNGVPVLTNRKTENAYAKEVLLPNRTVYFIKMCEGNLINPYTLYDKDLKKMVGDESKWKWFSVDKSTFNTYLKFLSTEHTFHYNTANRSLV